MINLRLLFKALSRYTRYFIKISQQAEELFLSRWLFAVFRAGQITMDPAERCLFRSAFRQPDAVDGSHQSILYGSESALPGADKRGICRDAGEEISIR